MACRSARKNREGKIVAVVFEDDERHCFRLQIPPAEAPLPGDFPSAEMAWAFFREHHNAETGEPL